MAILIDFTGNVSRELHELQRLTKHQANRIESLSLDLNKTEETIKALTAKLEFVQGVDSAFAIDFTKLNVFSIERSSDQTAIGYVDCSGIVREWFFQCSMETHLRLVSEYNTCRQKGNTDGNS